jgi:hypothetical protein
VNTQITGPAPGSRPVLTALAWAWVLVPFLYGLYQLLAKVPALFSG